MQFFFLSQRRYKTSLKSVVIKRRCICKSTKLFCTFYPSLVVWLKMLGRLATLFPTLCILRKFCIKRILVFDNTQPYLSLGVHLINFYIKRHIHNVTNFELIFNWFDFYETTLFWQTFCGTTCSRILANSFINKNCNLFIWLHRLPTSLIPEIVTQFHQNFTCHRKYKITTYTVL